MQDTVDTFIAGLDLRTSGAAKKPLTFSVLRELTETDIARLDEPRNVQPPQIKKLRTRHHALARYLADGIPVGEAALMCGYNVSRVSILASDPAMQELIAHYRKQADERYFDGHVAMQELHLDAVEELRERLEESPEDFTEGQLTELLKVTADRTGLGPSSQQTVNIKHGIAERLQDARDRVARARDITPPPLELGN